MSAPEGPSDPVAEWARLLAERGADPEAALGIIEALEHDPRMRVAELARLAERLGALPQRRTREAILDEIARPHREALAARAKAAALKGPGTL